MLANLEGYAVAVGVVQITLGSSSAARSFYEKHGYSSNGEPQPGFGVPHAFPYAKSVTA